VYNDKERSKIITDKVEKSAIKAIVNRKGPAAVVKHLLKSELYKSALLKCVSTEIIKETSALTKKPETDFKVSTTNKLMNFSWIDQFDIIKLKMPTLSSVLASFVTKQKSMARFVVAVSVLLYTRNQFLNLMQYVLGLVLDGCGLNKEVIEFTYSLNFTRFQLNLFRLLGCCNIILVI
jgi:hypothetical protein